MIYLAGKGTLHDPTVGISSKFSARMFRAHKDGPVVKRGVSGTYEFLSILSLIFSKGEDSRALQKCWLSLSTSTAD